MFSEWHGILPEVIVVATLLVVLVVDLVLPNRAKWTLPGICAVGLGLAAIPLVTLWVSHHDRVLFGGSYVVDEFALVLKGLFLVTGYVVLFLSFNLIEEGPYYRGEFYFLLLSSIVGMMLMASARDLIVMFIAFEALSTPGYLLAAWKKYDLRSNESGMKYFILGVVSTAIMLYGMSFLYGIAGTTRFSELAHRLGEIGTSADQFPLLAMGIVLVLIGFAFKVSAVPFHFWAPDTYEGAPTPVTAFFSTAVKAGGFVGLIVLLYAGLSANGDVWKPMMWILAAITMTVGNVIALRQTNMVRMLAYSSIAQSGFILAPLAVVGNSPESTALALQSAVVYLGIYTFMNLGAFAVVIAVSRRTHSGEIRSYNGLWRSAPALATTLALFLASLAGIPPLGGWLAKFTVFRALVVDGQPSSYVLAAIAVVNSVIAAYYYLGVVRRMFFEDEAPELAATPAEQPPAPLALAIGALTIIIVLAGITPLFTWFGENAHLLAL
ncbi:MAG: NADH-quinone oxidoreductase subunit N [Acidimicrobiia bacterium]